MNELIVVTYKLPTDEWLKRMYGNNVDHVYDCTAFHDNELAKPEIKKLKRKYTDVKTFTCSFADYMNWVDNDAAYEEFALTGVCPLNRIDEDVDVGTESATQSIHLVLGMARSETASADFTVDIDDVGQIVITPKDASSSFVNVSREVVVPGNDESTVYTTVDLTANMISEDNNFEWFLDIDEIGQVVITPESETASFLSASVDGSLNLVTESHDRVSSEIQLSECGDDVLLKESRDFDWDAELYAVIKDDGSYAGVPCLSYEEAQQLSYHPGSRIFKLVAVDSELEEDVESAETLDVVNKVMRGDIPIYRGEGTPDSNMTHITELDSCHGNSKFEYYYDKDSNSVVSYEIHGESC